MVNHAIYDDDLCIYVEKPNIKQLKPILQEEINKIYLFCEEWCLKLNSSKTTYTVFTPAGKRKSYERLYSMDLALNGHKIALDPYPKLLGIILDPKLSFMKHIEYISDKVTDRQNVIKALKGRLWSSNIKLLLNYYKTCILSIFEYSHIAIITSKNALDRLQILQNKTLRLCLSSDYMDSTEHIHSQAKIEMVKPRLLKLTHRYYDKIIINGENHQVINEIIDQNQINKNYKSKQHKKKRRTTCLDEYTHTLF